MSHDAAQQAIRSQSGLYIEHSHYSATRSSESCIENLTFAGRGVSTFVALFYRVSEASRSICREAARHLTHKMARPFAVAIQL
jgi:hypothetical protein